MKANMYLQINSLILIILIGLILANAIDAVIDQNKTIIDNQNTILQAIKTNSSINTLSQIETLLEDNKRLTLDNEYKATYIKEFDEILNEQVNFTKLQRRWEDD